MLLVYDCAALSKCIPILAFQALLWYVCKRGFLAFSLEQMSAFAGAAVLQDCEGNPGMGVYGDTKLYPEWGTVTITFVTPLPAVVPDSFSTSYGTVLRVEGKNSAQVGGLC
jgi:hypothetical protein